MRFKKFGSQDRSKPHVVTPAPPVQSVPQGPGTLELIRRYVVVHHKGEYLPCPDLDTAKRWAQEHGTRRYPVKVEQHGSIVYRYPEKR